MRKSANISMTEAHSALVERLIASGRYANVSEVVRAGFRLLQREEEPFSAAELAVLERVFDEGLASGPSEPLEPLAERLAQYESRFLASPNEN